MLDNGLRVMVNSDDPAYFGGYLNTNLIETSKALNLRIEDIKAIEGMQEGRNSPVFNGGNFSPIMDQPTHQFHKWVANSLLE